MRRFGFHPIPTQLSSPQRLQSNFYRRFSIRSSCYQLLFPAPQQPSVFSTSNIHPSTKCLVSLIIVDEIANNLKENSFLNERMIFKISIQFEYIFRINEIYGLCPLRNKI